MQRISKHVRQNLVAYLALFVALTGSTAYAANTVFSADIVNGEVKTPDLAAAAVAGNKLGPNAVSSAKVLDNSLTGDDIESLGQADLGANSVAASEFDTVVERRDPAPPVIEVNDPEDGNYSFRTSTASCDTGEQLIGGGAEWGGEQDTDELFIREMKRVTLFGATGWEVTGGSDAVHRPKGDHPGVALIAVAYCLDNS
jgi:hypothetical protein